MTYSRLFSFVFSATFLFLPGAAFCEELKTDESGEQVGESITVSPNESGSFHAFANVGYVPPFVDMDDYDAGGLALNLGVTRIVYGRVLVGARAKYQPLLISSDANLYVHFIELHARAGRFVTGGFQMFHELGMTVVGDMAYGNAHHTPYFSLASGGSYTFWSKRNKGHGVEIGFELSAMISSDYQAASWRSATWLNNLFISMMHFIGYRFSWNPCLSNGGK